MGEREDAKELLEGTGLAFSIVVIVFAVIILVCP
jgi:hypothetical protein